MRFRATPRYPVDIENLFGAQQLFSHIPEDMALAPVKRIVLIAESFVPKIDGVSQTAYLTLRYLQATGREVLVFAPDISPTQIGNSRVIPIRSFPLPMYPEMRLGYPVRRIYREIKAFAPDLIHAFNPVFMSMPAMYYAARQGVPMIGMYQTDLPEYLRYYNMRYLGGLMYWWMRVSAYNRLNLTLTPTDVQRERLVERRYKRVHTWRHGVDLERFNPAHKRQEWRERLLAGRDPDSLLCLYVGRLAREKSIDDLLELARQPGISLALVGDGGARPNLEQLFAGTGTHFAGYLTGQDLSEAFASADVFVFASRTETFGLVVQEAFASGLPVAAIAAGGVAQQVDHGMNGLLVNSAVELRDAVLYLRDHPGERQRMAEAARRRAEQYSWIAIMRELEQYYRQVL